MQLFITQQAVDYMRERDASVMVHPIPLVLGQSLP